MNKDITNEDMKHFMRMKDQFEEYTFYADMLECFNDCNFEQEEKYTITVQKGEENPKTIEVTGNLLERFHLFLMETYLDLSSLAE